MKLKAIENKKDKLKVEVDGTSHTLLNLLREKAWKSGAKQAAYMIEHPYMAKPKIIIHSDNPKKVLASSADMVIDEAKEFSRELKKAMKK